MTYACKLCLCVMSVLFVTSLQAQEASNELSIPEFEAPAIDAFSAVIERPLFLTSRRSASFPDSEFNETLFNKNVTVTNFYLSGIIFDGAEFTALIKSSENGDAQKLKKGAVIEGWLVEDIKPEQVWLSSGVNISIISLRDNKLTQAKQSELLQKSRIARLIEQQKQKMLKAQKNRNN